MDTSQLTDRQSQPASTDNDQAIADLISRLLDQRAAGESVELETVCRQHPELAAICVSFGARCWLRTRLLNSQRERRKAILPGNQDSAIELPLPLGSVHAGAGAWPRWHGDRLSSDH